MAKKEQDAPIYTVTRRFQDAPEFRTAGQARVYEIGDDVSHMDPRRLEALVGRSNVTVTMPPAPEPPTPPAPPKPKQPAPETPNA